MTRALALLYSLLLSASAHAEKPALALVIDDLGYSLDQAKKILQLPGEHTYAILPSTTYGRKIAHMATDSGREIILHMPMQSSGDNKIEDTALHDGMSEDQISVSVTSMIHEFPRIKGFNNHMGSRMTEIGYMMRPVMETVRGLNQNLYFLDSRTTPLSKAYQQALRAGVATLKRDVFLDFDHTNPESIEFQYDLWLEKARQKGYAIAIGHPHQSTIDVLARRLPESFADYRFMTLSQLIESQQKEKALWLAYLSQLQKDSKN
ncbi:MAG: divergent polysaccharide deacetylase family protein [Gammaproteobacteria bacterium]|nr:divergent polysaccharide deacetylase family protein [Gammaproteobacteria bacterium]